MHRCGHLGDEPPMVIPYRGCGQCGNIQYTSHLGRTTLKSPCDGCVQSGAWVRYDGQWMAKQSAEAAAAAAGNN